jgi:hypothetical protein
MLAKKSKGSDFRNGSAAFCVSVTGLHQFSSRLNGWKLNISNTSKNIPKMIMGIRINEATQ